MSELPVIAAVDGSEHSLRGLEWALDAARLRGAELLVAHVWPWPPNLHGTPEPPPAVPSADEDPVLEDVRTWLAGRGDTPLVRFTTLTGTPSATLPELGAQAQLLVLGSRGRGGFASLLLGSNGRAAAAHAGCPVVVVPHGERGREPGFGPAGRVVLGLEPEETVDDVVRFAFDEALRRGARLQVVTTYPVPFSTLALMGAAQVDPGDPEGPQIAREVARAQRERLSHSTRGRSDEVDVEWVVAAGDAAGRLVDASESAGLVVVGRHRHRMRHPGMFFGSVSNAVLLHARCPIAVVPPPER
ncbi:universal stress protein [Streptomyces sp. TRM 70351]|uniref:universal stress protein n=1 Tax=Streptomyces sp. TRM 70351 TaxID=3116552 RepID=UPI002E7B8511|nr:universal stress protein [Streptomyces sp. TRM 70351]MEE1926968.1 universal stress protein [Streptomyces sp. TRM 70351]